MVPTVKTGPLVGLIIQILLLAGLATSVGLGGAGWLAGAAYGAVTCGALTQGMIRAGRTTLGPADRVTLTRATLVGGITALVADALLVTDVLPAVAGGLAPPGPVAAMAGLGTVALLLDAVDGRVARRTGTTNALGARFDMEVDASLILVLSVYVASLVGGWVLAIGAMRYAFGVAASALPWLRGWLPPRFWRKVVAAVQGIVLVVVTADVLPRPLAAAALAGALALLVESFGRDIGWLWRRRHVPADREAALATR